MADVQADDLVWTAPGPGSWVWLGSHFAGRRRPALSGILAVEPAEC
jgi:hypothetical protein